jgi:hypothetical protein
MSLYTVPALNAVDFALAAHSVPSLASPQNVLAAYSVPALSAVNFALTGYTQPTYPYVGWELLPDLSFPVQYSGLRYFHGTVKELSLVAIADAPAGDQWRVQKNGTTYAVYLVDTADPNASAVRVQTSEGLKAARIKT